MEHLLTFWSKIAPQIKGAAHILLISDYDGTLAPIEAHPDMVQLPADTKRLLESLACRPHFSVSVISGRKLTDVKKHFSLERIIYAGNHGLEIEGQGISYVNPQAKEIEPVFRTLVSVLKKALETIPGAWVEDKGLTVSVHFRQVDESKAEAVGKIVQKVVGRAQAAGLVRFFPGKKIWEIRPAIDWDKGKAIKFLINKEGAKKKNGYLFPIFMGDDVTDEDGFQAIEKYGKGLAVFVGEPAPTSARYFLNSTDEVKKFLKLLLENAQTSP